MADKFHVINDATVVLREKGIYRQVAVFRLGQRLFAEYRKGAFTALITGGGTSAPNVSWSDLDTPQPFAHREGRVVILNT